MHRSSQSIKMILILFVPSKFKVLRMFQFDESLPVNNPLLKQLHLVWHCIQDSYVNWFNNFFRFGAIFNLGRIVFDDFRSGFEKGPWWQRLFNGYTITTWLVVLNLGSTGLLVSWLMKFADNIVKVYISSSCFAASFLQMTALIINGNLCFSCRYTQHQWQCYWPWSYPSTSSILNQLCRLASCIRFGWIYFLSVNFL